MKDDIGGFLCDGTEFFEDGGCADSAVQLNWTRVGSWQVTQRVSRLKGGVAPRPYGGERGRNSPHGVSEALT